MLISLKVARRFVSIPAANVGLFVVKITVVNMRSSMKTADVKH